MSDEKTNAEPSVASGGSQLVALERLLELARREHYYCEDSWYSCPLAEDGCANDSYAKDECSCGASAHNAEIDRIAATLRPLLERIG